MMLTRRHFLAAAAFLSLLPTVAEAGLRERIQARRERKAGQGTGPVKPVTCNYGPALLDVYAPEGASGLPVMLFVHGGGWRHGTRDYVQSKPELFLREGHIFVSIDYRMLPDFDVASQARDVEAAYAFVRSTIAKHGGDPERIAVMGHSAGCHLVALTGLRGGLPGAKALIFNDVEAYDIQALSDNGHMRRIYGAAFADPAQWKPLSPSTYAARGGHPPIMIAYSKVKGHKQASEAIAAKLMAAGDRVTLFDGRAYSHGEINRGLGGSATEMTKAVLTFLKSALA